MDIANHAGEHLGNRVLQQIRGGSGLNGAVDVLVPLIHGQGDEACVRVLPANRRDGLDAVHARELEIHERDIRRMPPELLDGFFPVAGFGDDGHPRFEIR